MKEPENQSRYPLGGRIWIDGPEGTYLAYGRVVLMERIREHGSISAAARSMNMSYRHAWELVESMNKQSLNPVVIKRTGGKGGGGAVLTKAGENAINCFWAAYHDFQKYLAKYSKRLDL
ncbi:MAG: LysR family transcriptional regulator [Candidatus Electryonea clarkiae]|nr:LysR family transcriptional regulator [Candidatus Electryonea clarkiae]MDP8287107.1 LysR family transcriptional regulator [Candidatus Electryonea clarkiae]